MPEHIPNRPLEELATITMGQSPESATVNSDERGLPFLQGCAEFGSRHPTARLHCSPPLRVAKVGSTLISVRAPVGTTNRADQDYCIGRGLGAVLAKPGEADNVFLLSAIEHGAGYLHRRSQGSTFLAISSDDLRSMPVPSPGIDAQMWIADCVSTVDEAIEQTEALIAKTQQIKAGLMQDLFTRGVTPDGQLRPPRGEAPKLYKESPLGWIPKEWRIHSIGEIADSLVDGPFGSHLKTEHYVIEAGVRVVRLQNIQEGQYDDTDRAYVSGRHADFLSRYSVRSHDVLIAGMGDENYAVGRACSYPDDLSPAINKADCYRLRCRPEEAHNDFVALSLNSVVARLQARRFEQGVTRRRMNLGNFRRMLLPTPDLDEQTQCVALLSAVNERFGAIESLAIKLRLVKQGLMSDLLTGRVRVPVVDAQKVAANV